MCKNKMKFSVNKSLRGEEWFISHFHLKYFFIRNNNNTIDCNCKVQKPLHINKCLLRNELCERFDTFGNRAVIGRICFFKYILVAIWRHFKFLSFCTATLKFVLIKYQLNYCYCLQNIFYSHYMRISNWMFFIWLYSYFGLDAMYRPCANNYDIPVIILGSYSITLNRDL